MKYKKDQYISGFSICSLLIAGMFFYWGIDAFLHGFWYFGISWMGFLWFGIGLAILSGQVAAIVNRSKLRSVVLQEFESNSKVSIEEISGNTGISVRDIRAIVLDLKASGKLKGSFSPTTGSAEEMQVSPKVEEDLSTTPRGNYCSNCGTPVERETAVYCAYCGSKL
jgi:membrane protein implicated in regulation of membrane protease activity